MNLSDMELLKVFCIHKLANIKIADDPKSKGFKAMPHERVRIQAEFQLLHSGVRLPKEVIVRSQKVRLSMQRVPSSPDFIRA